MPELDVFLVLLPAEKDLASADNSGEIDETAGNVLDENLSLLKFGKNLLKVGEGADPLIDGFAAGVAAEFRHAAQPFIKALEVGAEAIQGIQPLPDLREQLAGFITGIVAMETKTHG